MPTYIFIRADAFYFLDLPDDREARKNAESNPGTVSVENTQGETVWPLNPKCDHCGGAMLEQQTESVGYFHCQTAECFGVFMTFAAHRELQQCLEQEWARQKMHVSGNN